MEAFEIQRAYEEIWEGGGILFPFRNGYERLSLLLDVLPNDAWRNDEAVLGGLVLYLVLSDKTRLRRAGWSRSLSV